jgi:periplasmic divalent cation tolerance protein
VIEHVVVLMTASSQQEAEGLAQALVSERLAASVNIVPGITSLYHWQGAIQHDQEWLLLAKSRGDRLDALVKRTRELHSYEVPQVIALPLAGGSEDYLRWIDEVTGSD